MKKYLTLIILILPYLLVANIIEIKQDGSGDYVTIQAGVDAAAENDTVLVYPATYYENVLIHEKQIILGSLTLITGDISYKQTTIIDGNQTGSCIQISGEDPFKSNRTDSVTVVGFTLRHGIGEFMYEGTSNKDGGGVLMWYTVASISECVIKHNTTSGSGGGIMVFESQLNLSGVSIHHNKSRCIGGGLAISGMDDSNNSIVYFDNENLCNIYNNYACIGNDFIKSYDLPYVEVIVDTFTVTNPSIYYIAHIDQYGISHPDLLGFSMQNAYYQQIDADLYLSPDGDDSNSGLTEAEPLQTIAHALTLIKSDSLNPHTLFLADGVYSQNLNNQWFPIHAKGYVSIIGESRENTIIDAEELSGYLFRKETDFNFTIKNINFINGKENFFFKVNIYFSDPYKRNDTITMENVVIEDSKAKNLQMSVLNLNCKLKNVNFLNNLSSGTLWLYSYNQEKSIIENCSIINNDQWPDNPDVFYNRPVRLGGDTSNLAEDFPEYTLINTEITNCADYCWEWLESAGAIYTVWNSKINIINCTIADNSSTAGLGAAICGDHENSYMNIYNSIIYGNGPRQIVIANEYAEEAGPYILNLKNSLIQPGDEQVYDAYGGNEINWLGGNLESDPHFSDIGDFPYSLCVNSPCIDAGTTELPAGIELPETDLAGNPRIVGETIDMGCYEYQGSGNSDEEQVPAPKKSLLSAYPNPFHLQVGTRATANVKLELARAGNVRLELYNLKGEKVKTLMDAYLSTGTYKVRWDGRDNNGKYVASGTYFCKFAREGNLRQVRKITVVK